MTMLTEQYEAQAVETEAQQFWDKQQSAKANEDLSMEKFYCLTMFPYPSGHLHMGHMRVYTITDVIARYQRMLGKNVMQPMGWDAFGLPAENAAIQKNIAPAKWTYDNIAYMREQLKRLGFSYDWRRELVTCDPDYYRWEQWLFTRLFKKGLAYKKKSVVNWDPVDNTVLANEQVIDGRGWRSGALVERREIPQWFLKITDYTEELLQDLDKLEHWPEQVKTMQRNWIGRSEGVVIHFPLTDSEKTIEVFTTRADTLFGVSYIAIAPQHPLALTASKTNAELAKFIDKCKHVSVAEAAIATMEKEGMPIGLSVHHPFTNELLPVWVANFVVMDYGSGAVMSVPAHDERDHEFALKYQLLIKPVIATVDNINWNYQQAAYTEKNELINSSEYNGLTSDEAIKKIANALEDKKLGLIKVNYRLRDWGVSRQRYWGAPIPIINCQTCGSVPVPEQDLPIILPTEVKFSGTNSPLKSMPEFYQTVCPQCQQPAERETDTFDTFIESSWYYARYASYNQELTMLDDRAKYWTPVDQYVGGIEHAVLHLLYARFFHKILRDEGLVNSDEPFVKLLTQGMVLKDGAKMSKSKGNVVNPEPLLQQYGADTARVFMMFAAPPEISLEWSDAGVDGANRFLKRLWALSFKQQVLIKHLNKALKADNLAPIQWEHVTPDITKVRRQIHEILKQARFDYERQQFNTVVSACMKLFNILAELSAAQNLSDKNPCVAERVFHEGLSILLRLLAPIAPHICHRLWRDLQFGDNIIIAKWPKVNQDALKTQQLDIVVQVNGKLRAQIAVPVNAEQAMIENIAKADDNVAKAIADKNIKKVILVPGKLLNFVVG